MRYPPATLGPGGVGLGLGEGLGDGVGEPLQSVLLLHFVTPSLPQIPPLPPLG